MTPGDGRISRRAFIAGAGALLLGGCDLSRPRPQPTRTAPSTITSGTTTVASQPVETVDLAVRWRHLEPRVERAGLVAGWPLDEGSGYAFADVSGHAHTLWITGSEWNTRDTGLISGIHRRGRRGGGVYVDGTRWLAALASDSFAVGRAMTLSLWARLDALPIGSGAALISYGDSYSLTATNDGATRFTMRGRDGASHVVSSTGGSLVVGEWTHIAVVAAPSTGQLTIYVDGDKRVERTWPPFTVAGGQDLAVGRGVVGCLDELTLHDVALTPAEIATLYVVGLPKVYTQTRETLDVAKHVWTRFKGSEPIPHPIDDATVFTARFDGSGRSEQGADPVTDAGAVFVPGAFGGAFQAVGSPLSYPSPLRGGSGTFEVWYETIHDPSDPDRARRKVLLQATGTQDALTLYTQAGRWCLDVDTSGGTTQTLTGLPQTFTPGTLEHVAVSWGRQDRGPADVVLFVNGVETARQPMLVADAAFGEHIVIGGSAETSAYCLVDDLRLCDEARSWGDICPRGQAATEAAGLDLRDGFDRPTGAAPMWWRATSNLASWTQGTNPARTSDVTGADPADSQALHQGTAAGLHAIYHPDALGFASSIEVGVSFATAADGWAGVFVQSSGAGSTIDGFSYAINPARRQLRIAQVNDGSLVAVKTLAYDFATGAATTYELTLTSAGDGVVRGFVDGNNVISLRADTGSDSQGYAGLFTDGTEAFFDNVHFCALTPATASSRLVQTRVLSCGEGARYDDLQLTPFRWHKRRGQLPWQYRSKNPEPPGNIAGAQTAVPQRPIAPAYWRSEDSANSDLITVDNQVICFMRGTARVDGAASSGRIGVLHKAVDRFDGIHFYDPDRSIDALTIGNVLHSDLLQGNLLQDSASEATPSGPDRLTLNSPASAYVGSGRLLFFAKEKVTTIETAPNYRRLAYAYYDVHTNGWVDPRPSYVDLSSTVPASRRLRFTEIGGSPEVVSLRDPDDDEYTVVLYHETTADGEPVMAMTGLRPDDHGVPMVDPDLPTVASIGRASHRAIYGFRVMFDNGIYYLHYNEGPDVPDWPDRFVLAATLDPYAGPWIVNPSSDDPSGSYFRRGTEFEPDNGAIWQGTMFKHRGHYYLYYENYHSTGDVNAPYRKYNDPQAGSRVGYATSV